MIPRDVVKFFQNTFDVDISDVEVSYEGDFYDCSGFYEHYSHRINISKKLEQEHRLKTLTIVHELAHVMQFEHNKSICLNLSDFVTAEDYAMADVGIVWYERALEIDADITALYFFFKKYGDIRNLIKLKFLKVEDYEHLAERINSIRIDNSFKNVIIDTLLV